MKVPFRLARSAGPASSPPAAVLVETDRVEPLLGLLSRLGPGPAPAIHRVAGGFLVRLGAGAAPPPGSARLRRLSGGIYLPADAELVPGLLDDEAEAFGRGRGVVFAPGGRTLGFDPDRPIGLPSLVVAEADAPPAAWEPFPDRPARVDRISEIVRDLPDEAAASILGRAGDGDPSGIGSEGPPRPEASGPASTLIGRAMMGLGRGLVGLGKGIGSPGLAGLGASWIVGAVGRVPRLTEALLGRQEGAIRELIRQFRDGEVDRALRHAVPIGGPGEADGPAAPAGDRLPGQDPRYSLAALLGSGRGRGAAGWQVAADVHAELARAYGKAADDAENAGDFRRAALIRGRLLHDYRAAAILLEKGGLHRDAAALYLHRLDDIPAAARCFEAAGEPDRALRLLRDRRMHAEAGDLLRRLGDEDEAVAEYVAAARLLSHGPAHDHLAAGDLLATRARRADLAIAAYVQGWKARPARNAVPCALRMARIHADGKAIDPLIDLVDQADAWFTRPGLATEANAFYNGLAGLADSLGLADARDDLRDRALMGLAAQLRRVAGTYLRPGFLTSTYVGSWTAWSADVVADATHAIAAAVDRPQTIPTFRPAPRRISATGYGNVTATCHAPGSGDLFLGFDDGAIVQVRVDNGEISRLPDRRALGFPHSMAVDAEGGLIIVLSSGSGSLVEGWIRKAVPGGWTPIEYHCRDSIDGASITPIVQSGKFLNFALCHPSGSMFGGHYSLLAELHIGRARIDFAEGLPPVALPVAAQGPVPRSTLIPHARGWLRVDHRGVVMGRFSTAWTPSRPDGHPVGAVPVSWLDVAPGQLEVAGLDDAGLVCWSALHLDDAGEAATSKYLGKGHPSYRAVALARSGLVAAARQGRVDWLRRGPKGLALIGSADLDLAEVAACFANPRTREVVVVGADGTLACVPIPD
ncbi:hypothetical protein TA3x_003962 [Tundrisphaera sp. TA3]|uniref:hypothetical protein n=1 Tax=Tundrisphaera sp. TA3 TaxID=3435775 RepID=UPI003EB87D22